MKVLVALDAPTWGHAGLPREQQVTHNRIASALRDIASAIEHDREQGTLERPGLTAKFKFDESPAGGPTVKADDDAA